MTNKVLSISDVPSIPAVYKMIGGRGRGQHVAYVGIADSLKRRLIQHLVRRSSVATGTSAVGLNPDYVTEVHWWIHRDFVKRHILKAAELIAFEVFSPVLRIRGKIQTRALELSRKQEFKRMMLKLFQNEPAGKLLTPSLQNILERIEAIERQLSQITKQETEK